MAGNAGNHRDGAVKGRSQFEGPNGNYIKRDTETGRFMDQKLLVGSLKVYEWRKRNSPVHQITSN